jgi:hypothetical protein
VYEQVWLSTADVQVRDRAHRGRRELDPEGRAERGRELGTGIEPVEEARTRSPATKKQRRQTQAAGRRAGPPRRGRSPGRTHLPRTADKALP